MTIIASYISIQAVAVQITIINNSHVFFTPHAGLQVSAIILIGQHVGAHQIKTARLYNKVLHCLGTFQSAVLGVFLFVFRWNIAEFYTSIPELQEQIAHVLIIYSFYHLLDGNKSVSSGVMRGLSRQASSSIISLLSYYVFSLPLQYLFGFYFNLGVTGLWMGQMFSAAFHMFSQLYLTYKHYDWNQIAKEAYERVQRDLLELAECENKQTHVCP